MIEQSKQLLDIALSSREISERAEIPCREIRLDSCCEFHSSVPLYMEKL